MEDHRYVIKAYPFDAERIHKRYSRYTVKGKQFDAELVTKRMCIYGHLFNVFVFNVTDNSFAVYM